MARDLTSIQQTLLSSNPYRVEKLIEIQTPGGSFYFTTGQFDVSLSTDTSGGTQTYLQENGVEIVGNIREYYTLVKNEISITIGDVSDLVFDDIIRLADDYDYQNTAVNIYLLFRDPNTGSAYTSETVDLFRGTISSVQVLRNEQDVRIDIRVTNQFANFDYKNGRKTSDFVNDKVANQINWGSSRSV